MCTAIRFSSFGSFFGRNLDIEKSPEESVVFVPRNFPLRFVKIPEMRRHFSIAGTAYVAGGYPLFYDGINEEGVFCAALNFPESAFYSDEKPGMKNLASFEVIPWILASCSNLGEVKKVLENTNILNVDFSSGIKKTPLHWFFADKTGSIAAEPVENGLKIYNDPFGVLSNEPPFEIMKEIAEKEKEIPGDFSSKSRFIKAAFGIKNAFSENRADSLSAAFHILDSVSVTKGCAEGKEKEFRTEYTSCADGEKGVYYYKTYGNNRISAFDMKKENPESDLLISCPMFTEQDIIGIN